jgi:hypothetical protein
MTRRGDKIGRMDTIELGKQLLQAIENSDNVAVSRLVLELEGATRDLRDENARLRQQVADLEVQIDLVESMNFDGTFYWRGAGEEREGPYCQKCLDGERRAVRLHFVDKTVSDYKSQWWECHNCQSKIEL